FASNDMADATVTLDIPEGGFVYDGTKKTPAVLSVILSGTEVPPDAYDVSYSANVASGIATATVTAKDGSGYSGKIDIPFYIAPVAIGTVDVDVVAPARGETAQTSVTAPANCADAEISWTVNGEPFEGEFESDTTYVATVTLTPVANHFFAEDVVCEGWTATVNDDGTLTLMREFYVPLITYTVTFMADGEVVAEKTVNHGETLTDIPDVPVKDGYTQLEPVWDITDFSNITSDLTVNAVYTLNTYTVTFMADGEVVAEKTVNHGETLTDIPDVPDKTGYDQQTPIWDTSDLSNIANDLTINAVYTRNVYTVRFMVDGVEIGTIRMEYGQSLASDAFPSVPEKEGYDAIWDRTAIDSIATDMTVTATYKQNYILGDVNGDGNVDTLDAAYILRYDACLIEADKLSMIAADINCDGEVNNMDAALILRSEVDLTYVLGDANSDGNVDTLDAAYILRYDAGLIEADKLSMIAADISCDGKVDTLDASLILKYEAGFIKSFDEASQNQ
ncbi:MAG: InlB B-repeat-containing protein, partial [Clostridia bacterium]|nr:InlB B-repeat-containing protein [Clostridia bacterium]